MPFVFAGSLNDSVHTAGSLSTFGEALQCWIYESAKGSPQKTMLTCVINELNVDQKQAQLVRICCILSDWRLCCTSSELNTHLWISSQILGNVRSQRGKRPWLETVCIYVRRLYMYVRLYECILCMYISMPSCEFMYYVNDRFSTHQKLYLLNSWMLFFKFLSSTGMGS